MTSIETAARSQMIGGLTFEAQLDKTLEKLRALLIEKNRSYGNSALDPVRLFAKTDAVEQLRVRIDDKISRLVRGLEFMGENTPTDFLGYLILLDIAERIAAEAVANGAA
ncbi:hypothetical protein [Hyphomicrobium sp. 802]|uniref:hypothetical protein n=1 Tax=Hyphomicrobium sp. 802 TaxID=1112272 RepID=UPI00045E8095|nr:hypothetical protein [Hyphomicrobium sp. 802]